jgi:hypothetical protein
MPKWDSNPISVLERAKTVRALDRAATAIGNYLELSIKIQTPYKYFLKIFLNVIPMYLYALCRSNPKILVTLDNVLKETVNFLQSLTPCGLFVAAYLGVCLQLLWVYAFTAP